MAKTWEDVHRAVAHAIWKEHPLLSYYGALVLADAALEAYENCEKPLAPRLLPESRVERIRHLFEVEPENG